MAGESQLTTDHETIRRWAEDRNGRAATVRGTPAGGGEAGILRIDFPDCGGQEDLEPICWEEFFEKFEQSNLAMVYQERTSQGQVSRFYQFVDRQG